MDYLLGTIGGIAFAGLGYYLAAQRSMYGEFVSFRARVKTIRQSAGRHVAMMAATDPSIGAFSFTFQDPGDYRKGGRGSHPLSRGGRCLAR